MRQHGQLMVLEVGDSEFQQLDLRRVCNAHCMAHPSHICFKVILGSGKLPRARKRGRHVLGVDTGRILCRIRDNEGIRSQEEGGGRGKQTRLYLT